MIELETDDLVLCACGNDLAEPGAHLCAGCAATQEALLAWAEAHDWPRLELQPGVAIAEGEPYWRIFLGFWGNALIWPMAARKAGLASGAGV